MRALATRPRRPVVNERIRPRRRATAAGVLHRREALHRLPIRARALHLHVLHVLHVRGHPRLRRVDRTQRGLRCRLRRARTRASRRRVGERRVLDGWCWWPTLLRMAVPDHAIRCRWGRHGRPVEELRVRLSRPTHDVSWRGNAYAGLVYSPWWHRTHIFRSWGARIEVESSVAKHRRRQARSPSARPDPHIVIDLLQELPARQVHTVGEVLLVL